MFPQNMAIANIYGGKSAAQKTNNYQQWPNTEPHQRHWQVHVWHPKTMAGGTEEDSDWRENSYGHDLLHVSA